MFTRHELAEFGFIPKSHYKLGHPFPEGFSLPKSITNEMFKKIPLYIQIRYSYTPIEGVHTLN
ncbi:hypothetical protein GW796_08445 [archaeon]|nr:hypothetical protein [archaeon]